MWPCLIVKMRLYWVRYTHFNELYTYKENIEHTEKCTGKKGIRVAGIRVMQLQAQQC